MKPAPAEVCAPCDGPHSARILYVSGAISGMPDNNRTLFNAAAAVLRAAGHLVINPIELSADRPTDATWEQHMRADIKVLMDCHAIVMLPGWHKSRGATLELQIARGLGMDVYAFVTPLLRMGV